MLKYIIKRILFTILYFSPGDPAYLALGDNATPEAVEAYRIEMGINGTYWERLGRTLLGLFQGDLRISYRSRTPVLNELLVRFSVTFNISAWSIVLGIILGIFFGIVAAQTEHHSGLSVHRVRFIWNFHADVLAGPDADSDFLRWTGLASGFGLRE